jgi:hypothetical protein
MTDLRHLHLELILHFCRRLQFNLRINLFLSETNCRDIIVSPLLFLFCLQSNFIPYTFLELIFIFLRTTLRTGCTHNYYRLGLIIIKLQNNKLNKLTSFYYLLFELIKDPSCIQPIRSLIFSKVINKIDFNTYLRYDLVPHKSYFLIKTIYLLMFRLIRLSPLCSHRNTQAK